MLIKFCDVWENMVEYYYASIQPCRDISIWEWIESEYGGQRYNYIPKHDFYEYIKFSNDADATAFKLKFLVTNDI